MKMNAFIFTSLGFVIGASFAVVTIEVIRRRQLTQ